MSEDIINLLEQIKIMRKIAGHFSQTIPLKMHYAHKQHSENTIRETLMGQSSSSQSGKGKIKESPVTHDVADKGKISRKIQTQQAATKPCAASMPSKIPKW